MFNRYKIKAKPEETNHTKTIITVTSTLFSSPTDVRTNSTNLTSQEDFFFFFLMGWGAVGNSMKYDGAVKSIRSQLCTLGNVLHFYFVSAEDYKRNSAYHQHPPFCTLRFSSLLSSFLYSISSPQFVGTGACSINEVNRQ